MIGVTNAIEQRTRWNVDSDTLLLITDTIEDKSNYHNTITNYGTNVTNLQRDSRNSIQANGNTGLRIDNVAAQLTTKFGGTNSWTIEMWAYITSYNSTGALFEINQRHNNAYAALMFLYSSNRYFYSSDNGGSWNRFNAIGTGTQTITNQWCHYCVCMEYPMFRIFQNGNLTYSYEMSSPFATPTAGETYIGARGANGIGTGHSLNLQDIRISTCARYTANFTPPTRFI